MCGLLGFLQVRDAVLGADKGTAHVDVHHQVVALHRCGLRVGEADGAGVVDQDVNAAEFSDTFFDGRNDLFLFPDIDRQRQRLAASRTDLLRGGINGPWQARIGFGRLRRDDHVRAIARRAQGDGFANAAARAGDEQGLALQCIHGLSVNV